MRVAFITTSLERGGAQRMLLNLVTQMSMDAIVPTVISLAAPSALSLELSRLGIRLHHLSMRPGRMSIRALLRLVRILKQEGPDLIQGWMYHGNLAAQLAAAMIPRCPPVAWSIRGNHTELSKEKRLTALTIWLGARLSALPAAIIYNSRASAQEHYRKLHFSREREVIIPNGFDTSLFQPSAEVRAAVRAELQIPARAVLVGLVARFHPVKDHATFLEAVAFSRRTHPDLRAVLVGAGTDRGNTELDALLKKTGTSDCVHCLGERTDMPRITAALDVACNTSISEGLPNAVGEAMACGVPCVVTDVGDSAWLVGDCGRIVPSGSASAVAAALSDLMSIGPDGRKLLGEHSRKRIADSFSLAAVTRHYQASYAGILSPGAL